MGRGLFSFWDKNRNEGGNKNDDKKISKNSHSKKGIKNCTTKSDASSNERSKKKNEEKIMKE
jgi:hypothetical protein